MMKWSIEQMGSKAKAATAIVILCGMVASAASYGATVYIDSRVELIVMAAMDDFRKEYQCDKLREEITRVASMPDSTPNQIELTRLNRLYEIRGCAKYEVF